MAPPIQKNSPKPNASTSVLDSEDGVIGGKPTKSAGDQIFTVFPGLYVPRLMRENVINEPQLSHTPEPSALKQ